MTALREAAMGAPWQPPIPSPTWHTEHATTRGPIDPDRNAPQPWTANAEIYRPPGT